MKTTFLIIIGIAIASVISLSYYATYESSTDVYISCTPKHEQIGDKCILLKPEQYCTDWCDVEELSTLGCDRLALDYIFRATNIIDGKPGEPHYWNWIGLPDGLSEEEFEMCSDILKEKRSEYDLENSDSNNTHVAESSERFCAYVGAKRLSPDEMQRIQDSPYHRPLKFLNFTDEHLSQIPSMKQVVDKLASSNFPPNDRGYVTVSGDELQQIKDYLTSKSDSEILSMHIVVDENMYSINGMMSFPINPDGETLNIQLDGTFEDRKDDFTEDAIKKNPSRNYVVLTYEELDEIKPIKDAIEQIGTWKTNIREANDVGGATQRQVIDFIESESLKQMGPDPEDQTFDFYYNGNYYLSEFAIC